MATREDELKKLIDIDIASGEQVLQGSKILPSDIEVSKAVKQKEQWRTSEEASFIDKTKAQIFQWQENTAFGALSKNSIDLTNFKQEEGHQEPSVYELTRMRGELGLKEEEFKKLSDAGKIGAEAFGAVYQEVKTASQNREMISKVLTENEQFYGGLATSLVDYDTLVSSVLTGGFGLGMKALSTGVKAKTATKLALASGITSATHPFVMNEINNEHRDMESMLQESIFRAVLETGASKLFIPTLKDDTVKAIAQATDIPSITKIDDRLTTPKITLDLKPAPITTKEIIEPTAIPSGNKILNEFTSKSVDDIAKELGSDTEYATFIKQEFNDKMAEYGHLVKNDDELLQRITNKDYEGAIDYVTKKTEGMTAQKVDVVEKFPRPKDMNEQMIDMIEADLVTASKKEFDKVGFGSTIQAFNNASKSFTEYIDGMKKYLTENSFDLTKMNSATLAIRTNIKDLLDDVQSLTGLTKQDKKLFSDVLNREVDDLLDVAKRQDELLSSAEKRAVQAETKSKTELFVESVRNSREELFKNITKTAQKTITDLTKKYDDAIKDVKRIEEKLASQADGVKSKGKSATDNTLATAQKELDKAKQAMDNAIEKEINKIAVDVADKNAKKITLVKDGEFYKFGKYKIPVAIAIGAFGTNAMASNGSGDIAISGLQQILALAILAGVGRHMYKKGVFGAIADKAFAGAEQGATAIQKTWIAKQNFTEAMRGDMNFLRTRFSGTYMPIMKYATESGNEELKKLTDFMLFNGLKGKSNTVEVGKKTFIAEMGSKYTSAETDLFSKWLKENGYGILDEVKNTIEGFSLRSKFREMVSDVKDGARTISGKGYEYVEEMAKRSKSLYDETISRLEELGVEGVEDMKKINGYVSRRFNTSVRELIVDAGDELPKIKEKLKAMYLSQAIKSKKEIDGISANLRKVVSKMDTIDSFKSFVEKNGKTLKTAVIEDTELSNMLDDFLNSETIEGAKASYTKFAKTVDDMVTEEKATLKIDEYVEHLKTDGYINSIADVMSPLKNRIPLDMKAFGEPLTINFRGKPREIKLNDLFDRDDYDLFSKYISSAGGRLSLKNAGYEVSQAQKIIDEIGNQTVKDEMNSVLKAVVGNPVVTDLTEHSSKMVQGLGNVAMGTMLMSFSFISTVQEMSMLGVRMMRHTDEGRFVFQNLKDIAHDIISNTGKDSAFTKVFAENMGSGLSSKSGIAHLRGEAHGALEGDSSGGYLYNATKYYRDKVITGRVFGIARWADALEKANGLANLTRLNNIVLKDEKYASFLMDKYGISAEDKLMLKKFLSFNDKGYPKMPQFENMSASEKLKFQTIMFNMNQFGAQIGTMGTTPQVIYATSIGNTFGKLLNYPINSIENIGMPMLKGVFRGEADAYIAVMSSYMGAYLAARLKTVALGREEKDDDYYHGLALMNMPMLAPASIMHGLTNPTVPSGIERTISAISGSNY